MKLHAIALALSVAAVASAEGLPRNWPMPPSGLESRFQHEHFVITDTEDAGTGRTGALKSRLRFDDGQTLQAKWKTVADKSLDDWNNSPRRELAAYRLQGFFLDEDDYVVPTSALRCLPTEEYAHVEVGAKPTLEGSSCVLGVVSVWMRDITAPAKFYDEERFGRDEAYARGLADFNLLTYLIAHRDGAEKNLMLSTDASDPRAFSIDNGISFGSFPYNMSVENWDKVRVPWLRKQSVDRIRATDEKTFASLGVVAEMQMDEHGVYQPTTLGENLDAGQGVRHADGRLQLGLTEHEIKELRVRVETLLRAVDSGQIEVR